MLLATLVLALLSLVLLLLVLMLLVLLVLWWRRGPVHCLRSGVVGCLPMRLVNGLERLLLQHMLV